MNVTTPLKPAVRRCVAIMCAMSCLAAACGEGSVNLHNQPLLTKSRVTMELASNLPNTSFYYRLQKLDDDPTQGWELVGTGNQVLAQLRKGGRYDLKATHQGYKRKLISLTEPIKRWQFKFLDADRIAPWDDTGIASDLPASPPFPPMDARPEVPRRPEDAPLGAIRKRWAVVIGVSAYKDPQIRNLRYAARDAEAFHDWLTSNNGGRYSPTNTKLLLDHEATAYNIREALFEWLEQALKEDFVTIYFSGHGTPSSPDAPNKLENLFLVPYDAKYDHIPASAIRMSDVQTALRSHIEARRVVVIADACHAGGVGSEFALVRRAIGAGDADAAGKVNQGLHDLSDVGPSVVVLTSARASQLSQENQRWGGGHGVFTHFLLEGLKGRARRDANHDRPVTLGELIPYVSQQVREATRNKQCPEVAGDYDPFLTIGG